MKPQKTFIAARIASFGYAFKGIATLIRTQPNAWIHLLATLVVIASGILLHVTTGEWAMLLLTMAIVWVAEALNTAIEHVVDLASPDHHPLAGKAKDIAAGAVLLAAIFAAGVASFIFLPHLFSCCNSSACHP
jgi:diacylglycerol kinase